MILVDDGSPDNCGAICDEYAAKDTRVRVIHQQNGGLSAARNAGIDWAFANSDSQWLSFIDSDDWVHARYLELLYRAARQYDAPISQCCILEVDGLSTPPEPGEQILCVTPEENYFNWYTPFAHCKLYKKECFEQLRYPVGILYEDVTIWYKLLFSVEKTAIVSEWLYYYYQRPDSIVHDEWKPAKLARYNAWTDQLRFFKAFGNPKLLERAVSRYFQVAANQIEGIQTSTLIAESEKKKYLHELTKEIRHYFIKYFNNPILKENRRHYLKLSFPILGVIHRFFKRC